MERLERQPPPDIEPIWPKLLDDARNLGNGSDAGTELDSLDSILHDYDEGLISSEEADKRYKGLPSGQNEISH